MFELYEYSMKYSFFVKKKSVLSSLKLQNVEEQLLIFKKDLFVQQLIH